ncbi:hypothetical protein MKQ68_23655 [Chitinophaga horti]|uniref:Uncharacterized protein n=1 Tax=Chitinophaga horti TaxID=2920382 RepID=A0ABY6J0A9_9BACT|nr:hypothetical protein [Chitinophaga horti]UYQ93081.1 hypothetical protein MKQ68_23655 [Chitinophaga horti]
MRRRVVRVSGQKMNGNEIAEQLSMLLQTVKKILATLLQHIPDTASDITTCMEKPPNNQGAYQMLMKN